MIYRAINRQTGKQLATGETLIECANAADRVCRWARTGPRGTMEPPYYLCRDDSHFSFLNTSLGDAVFTVLVASLSFLCFYLASTV